MKMNKNIKTKKPVNKILKQDKPMTISLANVPLAKKEILSLCYTVLRDTREQQGWIFEQGKLCNGTISKALKTGDYTLVGFESILCVERKKNVAEFAKNIIEKRFENELTRMEAF